MVMKMQNNFIAFAKEKTTLRPNWPQNNGDYLAGKSVNLTVPITKVNK